MTPRVENHFDTDTFHESKKKKKKIKRNLIRTITNLTNTYYKT